MVMRSAKIGATNCVKYIDMGIEADVVEESCERLLSIPGYGSSYVGLRT
jgi:hypothetical protein